MIAHRFAAAAERGDRAAMASLFADDVTYHTPATIADLHGKDLTLRFLAEGTRIVDDLEYTDQVSDDERAILFWRGNLDGRELLGATVLADEEGGLIHDITVLQRPWAVAATFRDTTLRALADVVPLPAWELDGHRVPSRTLTPASASGQAALLRWRRTSPSTAPSSPRRCTARRMSGRL